MSTCLQTHSQNRFDSSQKDFRAAVICFGLVCHTPFSACKKPISAILVGASWPRTRSRAVGQSSARSDNIPDNARPKRQRPDRGRIRACSRTGRRPSPCRAPQIVQTFVHPSIRMSMYEMGQKQTSRPQSTDVRFTPESGHRLSALRCPLWARS